MDGDQRVRRPVAAQGAVVCREVGQSASRQDHNFPGYGDAGHGLRSVPGRADAGKEVDGAGPGILLEKTFVHVQGVGYSTERRLWQQGADCWRSFLADPTTFHVPRPRLPGLLDTVSQSPD